MRRLSRFSRSAATADADATGANEVVEKADPGRIPAAPLRSTRDFIPLAVALAWGAGFIHAAVVPDHLDESFLHGAFFIVVAGMQLIWGGWAYRHPSPRVLWLGAIGSCFLAVVWLASRTIGVPDGLTTWDTERVGALDVIATLDALALAALVALILRPGHRLTTHRLLLASTFVGVLTMTSLFGPMVASHQHG